MRTIPMQMNQWLVRVSACLLMGIGLTGCSVFETSYVVEPEPVASFDAVASADDAFVAGPFSLVAADSVGLATFGYEIAQWDVMSPEALAQKY